MAQGSSRTEYSRNHKIIIRLQDYFLWRDYIKKTYRFKKYGLSFCESLYKRLEESYNPAKIKRWFDLLYRQLLDLKSKDDGFNIWIDDHFNPRHIEIAEQIEILDQQVMESVKDFKKQIKSGEQSESILHHLHHIEMGLDVIKNQAIELKKAFQSTYEIDDILTEILENPNAIPFLANVKRVRDFNDHVRSHLEQVSNRIEKIKPRIREFIYDFNQREFDRKTELFLKLLLSESTRARDSRNRKYIKPPWIFRFAKSLARSLFPNLFEFL